MTHLHGRDWAERSRSVVVSPMDFVPAFILSSVLGKRQIVHFLQVWLRIVFVSPSPKIKEIQSPFPRCLVSFQKCEIIHKISAELGSNCRRISIQLFEPFGMTLSAATSLLICRFALPKIDMCDSISC